MLNYLEADKSGVFGLNQMKQGWSESVDKVNAGATMKVSDDYVQEAALSWQQEERDMALILSRELGVLVNTGQAKYKGKLDERLKADRKELVTSKRLTSVFRVRGAISDIDIHALFDKRTVEMIVSFKPPMDKTLKGQLGWVRRQIESCSKKHEKLFGALENELYIEILIKNSRTSERYSFKQFDRISDDLKGKEIRELKILYLKDLGKKFSSPKKFVEVIESMLIDFYKGIVQYLVKWEPSAPKLSSVTKVVDDEGFIDQINSGVDQGGFVVFDKPVLEDETKSLDVLVASVDRE